MMTDDILQLITAAVDGELTAVEAQRLSQVLYTSPEACELYARLKADSDRLRVLPCVPPPADLLPRVMARIADSTPLPLPFPDSRTIPLAQPATGPRSLARTSWRQWVPLAVAASLLIGLTVGSYSYFHHKNAAVANTPKGSPGGTPNGAGDPGWAKVLPAPNVPLPSAPLPHERAVGPDKNNLVVEPKGLPASEPVAVAPEPRPIHSGALASPLLPETQFDLIEAQIPLLKPLANLEREDDRQQLAEELASDPAFRIDLFARNPARAVELFRAAAKAANVTVHIDANTLKQLPKVPANSVSLVVYTDSLTPAQVAALFGKLSAEDAKVSPRVFGVLHAVPVSSADEKLLRETLGIDPGLYKRPPAPGEKSGVGVTKPIGAGTADHIVKTVTGPASAVLMTWAPPPARTPPASSAELKQFLAKRGERKPEAVPVIIVIRPGN